MKKFLAIVVLGLLWSGSVYAEVYEFKMPFKGMTITSQGGND